jgi:hypothetical protein
MLFGVKLESVLIFLIEYMGVVYGKCLLGYV